MSDKAIENLRRLFDERLSAAASDTFYGTVKEVDEQRRTCQVEMDGAAFDDVLLYSAANDKLKGLCLIPKVDSMVLVSRIAGSNMLFVELFSEIDKVLLTVGDKVEATLDDTELTYENDKVSLSIKDNEVTLDADKITLNGGDNKGLVKIKELTDKINGLVDAFNNHTHTLLSGTVAVAGSATSQTNPAPVTVPAITSKHTKVQVSDYENEKVKH